MEPIKCPMCGKSFIPAPKHIYKATVGEKLWKLCGWNCLRKLEREKEAKKQARIKHKEEVKQNAGR